jgi:uncharacterized protein
MKESKFVWRSPNGDLRGKFIEVSPGAPCVLLCCGHNGFYHFGFFQTIQLHLARYGYSSVTFNYSHCGISNDGDFFDDLDSYEKNSRQLEKEDIYFMVTTLYSNKFYRNPEKIILLAHSMGGISALFSTSEFLNESNHVSGLALLCSLSTLDIRSNETMEEWKKNGVYFRENSRTKQMLPQGRAFLEETLASKGIWNAETAIKEVRKPLFIVHGECDESVPIVHSERLYAWSCETNMLVDYFVIPNADHNLNTSHLGARDSKELIAFVYHFVEWIDSL